MANCCFVNLLPWHKNEQTYSVKLLSIILSMGLPLISSAQLPPDSLIKKYKIKKTVVSISAPYPKDDL